MALQTVVEMWKEEAGVTNGKSEFQSTEGNRRSDELPERSEERSRSRSHSGDRKRTSCSRSRPSSRSRVRRSRSRSRSRGYRERGGVSGGGSRFSRREDPQPSRCLGVFGLSLYTTERDLKELFSQYGSVEKVQLVYDHFTGRSRGFAFVYFESVEDAVEAKKRVAGFEIDGNKVRVDFSITERAHTPTPGVYMGAVETRRGFRSGGYRRSPSPYRGYRGRYRSPQRDYYGTSSTRSRNGGYYSGGYEDYDRYSPPAYRSGGGYYRRSPSPRYFDHRRGRRSRSFDRDRKYY